MNGIKILIVDDNSDDVYIIKQLLKDITVIQLELLHKKSLNSGLDYLEKEKFECVLLDLNLPDSQGISTLKNVVNKFPELPIVILTIIDDEDIAIESLHYGAQDYLVKGKINGEIIFRSIRYAIERKKVENTLIQNERKYKDIVDTILEGLWIIDAEGKTTYVNKQLADMLGYTREDMLNLPFFDFVNKDFRDSAKQFFERRKKGIKDRYDFCFDKKDGSILWVIVSASPIFDNKGKFAGAIGLLTDITERKLTEESLKKSSQEWYSTFNSISDIVCIINNNGEILRCNDAAGKFFNKSSKEIVGNMCWKLVHGTSMPINECPILRMQKTHRREILTQKIGNKWFYSSADPLIDNTGNIIGAVHIMSDITKYKLYQNALKDSEEKFRALVENSTEYIIMIDLDGIIQFINRTISISREQAIGTSMYDYVPKKNIQNIRDSLERVRNTKKPEIYYVDYINLKDGSTLNFESHVGPIIKYNKVVGFIISSSDITERKKVENQLRDSEERYRTIIEHSNDMIWTLDSEGLFTFFNRRAEKISGYKLEDWKGKSFAPLIIPQDLPKVIDVFRTVLAGQSLEYEATFINKYSKKISLAINTAPIYSKGKIIGTVSFGRDITEQKKAESKVKSTTEELERSNKELEQFAYIASHDLQEPLRSISSFAKLLARRYKNKLDPDADEFIDYITNGTKRMQRMIDDLLILSRVGTKGKEFLPTDIKEVINDVLTNLKTLIEKNQAIITFDNMPIVNVDQTQLNQLFQNLIDNAIKFRKKDVIPKIHISAKQEGNEWIFSVQDNGIGIDPKNFSKLFVIFQRLHSREEYPGTGIGLVICKKIVARHGGRIWVESEIGKGSIFYFSIPIKRGENGNGINNK